MTAQPENRTTCPPGHSPYLSETVARNAVTLHQFAYPACPAMTYFACGDHFHIGHPTPADKVECVRYEYPSDRKGWRSIV